MAVGPIMAGQAAVPARQRLRWAIGGRMTQIIIPNDGPADQDFFLLDRTLEDLAVTQGLPATAFLPPRVAQHLYTVNDAHDANDLAYRIGGRSKKPTREVFLVGPDGHTPIVLPGFGVTEAAELQETAQEVYELHEKRIRETGSAVDFNRLRANAGLPSSEDAPEMIREAFWNRIQQHKRNPVSDPPRQPLQTRSYVPGVDLSIGAP